MKLSSDWVERGVITEGRMRYFNSTLSAHGGFDLNILCI